MIEEQKIHIEPTVIPEALPTQKSIIEQAIPLLPLKNMVVLPTSIVPIIVGRKSSIEAIEYALKYNNKTIFVTAQKNADVEDPDTTDLFEYGTKAIILQTMKTANNTLKVLIEGVQRTKIVELFKTRSFSSALLQNIDLENISSVETEANWRCFKTIYQAYTKLNTKAPTELIDTAFTTTEKETVIDTVAIHINISFLDRQKILETNDFSERIMLLTLLLKKEMEILKTEEKIKSRIQQQVEKNQREYYLSEQIKAIHKELGRDENAQEMNILRQKIKQLKLPDEVNEKVQKELNRLEQMPSISAETTISKHYIDWILALPWHKKSKDTISLTKAESILNKDHDHLLKIKERILEFVAAKKYTQNLKKSPTICLVGPPGVGKTSLAKSIATCLGREFTRISLGGIKDEAEIRGHRKTYIGALPGKILHAMKKVKTMNPVILLDEIDKLSHDFSGDPAAALLEVLDPEQNKTFVDHFLDTEYDLSQVMFIATANSVDSIPYALFDRMEIISLSGYTEGEKISIAQNFLIPKQIKEHELHKKKISIENSVLSQIIQEYTKEAGVRQLDRIIAKLMRKSIQEFLKHPELKSIAINSEKVTLWLGHDKIKRTELNKTKNLPGIATGLAWTELGGEVLEIEINILPGKGNFTLTGQLGEVMQESAQAALSYVRSKAQQFGIKKTTFTEKDIHVHFPEGATPKDGASAGITMTTALVSALTEIPLKPHLAMTGEVTLRGRILAIGGLKEKLLAAKQYGITNIILPTTNQSDLEEFKKEIEGLDIFFTDHMDQLLPHALIKDPFKNETILTERASKKTKKKNSLKKKNATK
ncbi:endopeptidase La [Candidatus Dependentiae bacterium]|nr:endopeptidase La [Candidatus Dependentiae bacterium]